MSLPTARRAAAAPVLPSIVRPMDGLRLVPATADGGDAYLVAERPLRVLRVKPVALDLLEQCARGRPVAEAVASLAGLSPAGAARFLQRLADLGMVDLTYPLTDAALLSVSIVIPVRNRPAAIETCLASLEALHYPADRVEVIVVDDASTDETPAVVERHGGRLPVRLARQETHHGQSACRNLGARLAHGDILAFTDSDCLADQDWLADLVPAFQDRTVAMVGGAVVPADEDDALQRYEAVRSPLYQGPEPAAVEPRARISYLASCNMLVRRDVFLAAGGFAPELASGEDVDLVWRLAERGLHVRYLPKGRIRHDHRDRLGPFLRRRAFYASSEATLLRRHPENGRRLVVPLAPIGGLIWALATVGIGRPWLAPAALLPVAAEVLLATRRARREGLPVGRLTLLRAMLGGYGSLLYWSAVNVARYYALPLAAVGILAGQLWTPAYGLAILVAACLVGPAALDWRRLRARLPLPAFVAYYVLDNLAYHIGGLLSCARQRTLRPLKLSLVPLRYQRGPAV